MLPLIKDIPALPQHYQKYLIALKNRGFLGEIEADYPARLLCATDNSVYQRLPQAVIFPASEEDVALALKLRAQSEFAQVVLTGRGGGTGTNGQSLTDGVVVDCSRHLRSFCEFDAGKREIWVQSGVIKDELNEYLKPHELFFSPELSTSSRATLGGMISNDAAGQGSLKYGRTSTHIKEVRVALSDGTLTTFGAVSGEELQRCLNKEGLEGEIYRGAYELLRSCHEQVERDFPKLNRFMTGYDLFHAYDPASDTLNLARLICGAEGTLGIIVGARLDLTSAPKFRALAVIKYSDFISALRHAPQLVQAGALSVETVDSKVLGLARSDVVWQSVHSYITDIPGQDIQGINIVEFAGAEESAERQKLQVLCAEVEQHLGERGLLGVQRVESAAGISAVYGMRKKAVGLLGNAAGARKLVPFTEDTVVPPEQLADYIVEFRALLDSMQVPYGMFGHVDTGLMHVRPALDLTQPEEREKLLKISDGVVQLVRKYGGQMWGEHGRGYRACYGELFFGKLYEQSRKIKALFDPHNILNPGKICVPYGNEVDHLVEVKSPMRGEYDALLPLAVRENFAEALSCNGNGQCFNYQRSALMCPSYRYSLDRCRSPKGYSELMRDLLRNLSQRGFSPVAEELRELTHLPNPVSFIKRCLNTLTEQKQDYSTQYLEKLSTCLSCKSCKGICPSHVNAADLNSRFLSWYYGRYLRPRMDLAVLNSERVLPWAARVPKLANYLQNSVLGRSVCRSLFSLVELPSFCEHSLTQRCKEEGFALLSLQSALKNRPQVLIVTDPFTVAYEAQGLMELAVVVRKLGFEVQFLKPYVNGKLRVIRGDRRGFVRYAARQAGRLQALAAAGVTLIGYDPALTICYRDEYTQLLGERRGSFEVLLPEEWLTRVLPTLKLPELLSGRVQKEGAALSPEPYYLFAHCTEKALLPASVRQWQEALKACGVEVVPVETACCGMAGLHGHMAEHLDETYKVYAQNWQGHFKKLPFERCLVTGFSCRSQVQRMEGKRPRHPLSVLAEVLCGS
ncbi:MAG: FAD-binding oxidoreductase [Succinivibrio sp.]|nr:FAD-binding oxidoreductase [Succinivibrio sp.]